MTLVVMQQQEGAKAPSLPIYRPKRVLLKAGHLGGSFQTTPSGVILHGSRSGIPTNTIDQEFVGTANYAQNPTHDLGWNATIGNDEVAIHIPPLQWGWNARRASSRFLAVEFAQPLVTSPISDGQVRAFCWLYTMHFRRVYPKLPYALPTHAELDAQGVTGTHDGKTDVFPYNSVYTERLRERIGRTLQEYDFESL